MLHLKESGRERPEMFMCECGQGVQMVLHRDFLEGTCNMCKRVYTVKVNVGIWNCCAQPDNDCEHTGKWEVWSYSGVFSTGTPVQRDMTFRDACELVATNHCYLMCPSGR